MKPQLLIESCPVPGFMPVHSVIYQEQRLVITTGEGRVTLDEIKANQDRLANDRDFDPEFNQLLDATAVTAMEITVDNIRQAVRRKLFSITSRRAFLVSSTFVYGMARMIQTYNELSQGATSVSVFRDRALALRWLGVPEKFPHN